MAFENQKREALHLLKAIENGRLPMHQVDTLFHDADEALVYLLIAWLRSRYGRHHPASEAVIHRIAELSAYPRVARKIRAGREDSFTVWFEEEYDYKDFASAEDFIDVLVEKLEG